MLASDNVDAAKIHWAPMPTSALIGALQHHQVGAILATEPTIYEAESQLGAVPVLDSCTGATANLPLDGYFTTSSYATKNARWWPPSGPRWTRRRPRRAWRHRCRPP